MEMGQAALPSSYPLYMNTTQFTEVETHRHLGVALSQTGSWYQHIAIKMQKAWQRTNNMRKFKFILDPDN